LHHCNIKLICLPAAAKLREKTNSCTVGDLRRAITLSTITSLHLKVSPTEKELRSRNQKCKHLQQQAKKERKKENQSIASGPFLKIEPTALLLIKLPLYHTK